MYRTELLIAVLLMGVFLLAYHERFPNWFHYVVMLGVLLATRRLAPAWFESTGLRTLWGVVVGVVTLGLALELFLPDSVTW